MDIILIQTSEKIRNLEKLDLHLGPDLAKLNLNLNMEEIDIDPTLKPGNVEIFRFRFINVDLDLEKLCPDLVLP